MGLVDRPATRKLHSGEVPVVGGISIYLTVLLVGVLLGVEFEFFLPLAVAFPIVIIGLLDDRHSLRASIRFTVQIGCALGMILFAQLTIQSVGNVIGSGSVMLTEFSANAFTIMCTVGAINSINIIDGVDGLSGSIIGLTLIAITYFAWAAGDVNVVLLLASLTTAIVGFLSYNVRLARRQASVFLGDAGSMFLGFVLVWYLIKCTQGPNAVLSPVSFGWILGLPLADTISVMVGRVLNGRSPFDAGRDHRDHFHHQLLDAGFSVNKTVMLMLAIQVAFIIIGGISNVVSGGEPIFFWLFVLVVVLHYFFTSRAVSYLVAVTDSENGLMKSSSHGID
jgi:UDP-GlcNAc:undecaprenyl-phosphate GlcNAc-1-phosphate transferase